MHVSAAVDNNGEVYDADFVGVTISLSYSTGFLDGTDVERDNGIVVDEHMRTNLEGVYAAGDITRYYDVLLDQPNQNGSWGSAKQQGMVAGANMAAGEPIETFRWVPSYSITHFDFPFLSFGHPTLGDDECERRYSETEWRRLTFKDGKLIGGVLIGNLSPQSAYKNLIRNEVDVSEKHEALLEPKVDIETVAPKQQ
jgi:NAD(P)H-nitrite reductase large subunit